MNCLKSASFTIEGAKLKCRNNHFNIQLDRQKFQIIKGTVFNQKQHPCKGAAIQVFQINCKNNDRSLLGYVLTDEAGEYLFAIEAKPFMKYEIIIYAPLS
ncbi:hypothetical protein C8E03_10255 [Lachnotalea glycerini]|uniref:Carboxypeptidase regulatory-like domain-containing protein n=1 Tax=Lachnotalea glycerini TaxID=1763509 RepID=A0A318ERD7_9FIRM|nr:hypothetical protein [Lachnotalea glycerini]OYO76233.1 hypothetical protein CG709_15545 [Lachnotalea glycerini]PXV93288.1 hypothetical protein C8E03_10255 [Lachnotalea glycerini]RDY31894.1 hypothetical protein CG710_007040 [Lachnotalea glycerini]